MPNSRPKERGTACRCPGSGRPSETEEGVQEIEEGMRYVAKELHIRSPYLQDARIYLQRSQGSIFSRPGKLDRADKGDLSREQSERSKPIVNIGAIGQFSSGKTSLAAAINTVLAKQYGSGARAFGQIDNTPEEKARGIIIINAIYV